MNASDDRKLETVRTKIKEIAQSAVIAIMFPSVSFFIIDESDKDKGCFKMP